MSNPKSPAELSREELFVWASEMLETPTDSKSLLNAKGWVDRSTEAAIRTVFVHVDRPNKLDKEEALRRADPDGKWEDLSMNLGYAIYLAEKIGK